MNKFSPTLRAMTMRASAHMSGVDPPRALFSTASRTLRNQRVRAEPATGFLDMQLFMPNSPTQLAVGLDVAPTPSIELPMTPMQMNIDPTTESMLSDLNLPFAIPQHSVLHEIGGTPVVRIEEGIYSKLEGFNPSGTIKDRAVAYTVLKMIEAGKLTDGSTLVLVTSGSAGVSLALLQNTLAQDCGFNLRTVIVMPKAYSHKSAPTKCAGMPGVKVVHDEMDTEAASQLLFLDGPFIDVLAEGKALAKDNQYEVLDQHYDINGRNAHRSTAMELLADMPDVTDVVCTTGTGATAAGLREFLPAHINVHARPAQSGTIDGLTDIRRYDNFCDPDSLIGYDGDFFDQEIAKAGQEALLEKNLTCGPSSGAALQLSKDVKASNPDAKIVYISACGQPLSEH